MLRGDFIIEEEEGTGITVNNDEIYESRDKLDVKQEKQQKVQELYERCDSNVSLHSHNPEEAEDQDENPDESLKYERIYQDK